MHPDFQFRRVRACCLTLPLMLASVATKAEDTTAVSVGDDDNIDEIVVTGSIVRPLELSEEAKASSRLGLTLMETPATVDVITSDVMDARGYQKVSDAVGSLAGVMAGELPTAPSMFSMRGFDRSQITVLRDGLWIGPASMTMRQQNTFNLERIEVLRGPASVLNGNGTVAGTVNTVSKTAKASNQHELNALASYGRWNTRHVGVGVGGPVSDTVFYRVDASHFGSDGYVERSDAHSTNITGSLLWQASDAVDIKLSFDYLDDEIGSYFGTPLVPLAAAKDPATGALTAESGETLDLATRYINYNVEDAESVADQLFLRADATWRVNEDVEINNSFYHYTADRSWKNAEGFVYCGEVVGVCDAESQGQVQRYYGYFLLSHDQENYGDRLTVNINKTIGGFETRSVVGAEYTNIDFVRTRGFRLNVGQTAGDSVDLYNPTPGLYGPEEIRGASPTEITTKAVFGENSIKLTPALSLVTALRYEEMDLTRQNFNGEGVEEANGFKREFSWWSWRAGVVYNIAEDFVAFAQYSNAKDPVGSNIFLVNANQDYDLTDANQWEIGLKAIALDGMLQATLSYYNIERDDILETFDRDSVGLIGGRTAEGVEFSTTLAPSKNIHLGFNAAYTDAKFTPGANVVSFAGNRPPNVPEWTMSAEANYSNIAGLRVNLGASVRYVGDRFANNDNTINLHDYTLVTVSGGWDVTDNVRLTAYVHNLFNTTYVPWSNVYYLQRVDPGFLYANQLVLGAPRSYSVSLQARF